MLDIPEAYPLFKKEPIASGDLFSSAHSETPNIHKQQDRRCHADPVLADAFRVSDILQHISL